MHVPAELEEAILYKKSLEWSREIPMEGDKKEIREKIGYLLEHLSIQVERGDITDEQKDYIYTDLIERANKKLPTN